MLVALRSFYILGLITNGPTNAQWEKIEELNLSNYFDCILVSADLPWEKPDKRIFHAACKYLDVESKECIMVGDKLETDIQVYHIIYYFNYYNYYFNSLFLK